MNPFKALPAVIALQIVLGFALTAPATIQFPDSDTSLNVEVAETPSEREKGLMYRDKLDIENGMLFVFPDEDYRGFWMKNTLIPLDIIFVDKERQIINIEEAYPEPNTSEENLKTYRSDRPAKYVIETNSSFTERRNIEEGDRVVIPDRFN